MAVGGVRTPHFVEPLSRPGLAAEGGGQAPVAAASLSFSDHLFPARVSVSLLEVPFLAARDLKRESKALLLSSPNAQIAY